MKIKSVLTAVFIVSVFCFTNVYASCESSPVDTPNQEVTVSTAKELDNAVRQAQQSGGNVTILLEDGVYEIINTFYIGTDNIALRGKSGNRDSVVLKGNGMNGNIPHIFVISADNITVADLTLGWVHNHGIQVQGEQDADNAHIQNVRFVDTREQMLKVSYSSSSTNRADNGLVEYCLFEYSAGIGPQYYIGGIDAHYTTDWIVRNNTLKYIRSPTSNLAEHAIHFWSGATNTLVEKNMIFDCDRGIGFGLGSRPHYGGTIRNNMVHTTRDVGIGLENASGVSVYNNTVYTLNYFNSIEYRFEDTRDGEIANNLTNRAIASRQGGTATLTTNYHSAQVSFFTDATNGDLHLASDDISQVVNQATDVGVIDDIDCEFRMAGSSGIGADEISPASITGDMNGDMNVDLIDLIITLQVATGTSASNIRPDYVDSAVDVNGNSKMGLEEAVFIMNNIAK